MIVDLPVLHGHRPPAMLRIIRIALVALVSAFRSRRDLALENLALRQQLAAFKSRGRSPRIRPGDRAFWIVLGRLWSRWTDALVVVAQLVGIGYGLPAAGAAVVCTHPPGTRAIRRMHSMRFLAAATVVTCLFLASCGESGHVTDGGTDACGGNRLGVQVSDTRGLSVGFALAAMPTGELLVLANHTRAVAGDGSMRLWAQLVGPTGVRWEAARDVSPGGASSWLLVGASIADDSAPVVFWSDDRNGDLDAFAQRLDAATGKSLWPQDIVVRALPGKRNTTGPSVGTSTGVYSIEEAPRNDTSGLSDLASNYLTVEGVAGPPISFGQTVGGGASRNRALARAFDDLVFAWVDLAGADNAGPQSTVVQRFAPNGSSSWPAPTRFEAPSSLRTVAVADDGADGAWVIQRVIPWSAEPCESNQGEESGFRCDFGCKYPTVTIAAQRVDAGGTATSEGDGKIIVEGSQLSLVGAWALPDGAVAIAWTKDPEDAQVQGCGQEYFLAYADASGDVQGPPLQLFPSTRIGVWDAVFLTGDGQHVHVVLFLHTDLDVAGLVDIYAEQVGPAGEPSWSSDGSGILVHRGCASRPRWALGAEADGQGGVWLVWEEGPVIDGASFPLRAERLDRSGRPTLAASDGFTEGASNQVRGSALETGGAP